MRTDIRLVATDATGSYLVRELRGMTGRGAVIQPLDQRSNSGLHRTWHSDGYVHDRTTNPPSTTSTGSITPPTQADEELWMREDLRAGALSIFKEVTSGESDFVIDLRGNDTFHRCEAWYLNPSTANQFVDGFAIAHGRIVNQFQDTDAQRVRYVVAYVPFGV